MEFRILGPLELWSRGQRHHLNWARERCVLAVLLLSPGRPVPTEVLIDRVWDADPPERARDRLYPHITRLRRILNSLDDGVRLDHRSGAYVLDADPETIDYHRFRSLCDQARAIAASGHPEDAIALYGEALGLARGEPLGGVTGRWAAQRRHGIRDELLGAALARARLELDQGRHGELVARLNELVDHFPHDEKPVELLMLALHRSGRSAEALRVYERARQRLAAELGATPHADLRRLHERILAGDSSLIAGPRPAGGAPPPNNLPRDLATFTGRTRELERLTAMAEHDGGTTKVVAVDGMPGVGKTVLVVRLAHRLAARYPDGQIFLDLYGHDTENEPLAPAAALDQLLRLLGIPADRIPADLDGRAGLWRTELARRRVLLVLDNALGHDQIRRLLPGSPGCLVLITSRRRLSGLDAARAFSLDVLGPDEAALLLTRVAELSPDADPAAVATVARLCGHLPLALQLVGNRLRHRSSWTVADLTARLGADGRRLAELRAEERAVVTAFRLSYDGLDAVTRRAFRLLGLHPGAEVTAPDTAALLNTDRAQAEYLLDALHDHHLISEPKPGRYRFHDLIHEYARQLADRDPAPAREAALDRLLDHYLTTAEQADAALFPRSAAPSAFETADQARQWLDAELHNLLRAARHAADRGRHRHAALLARALRQYLEQQGPWSEAAVLHERAVQAWRTLGDDRQAALAMADLSRILLRAGHHEDSLHHATRGLRIGRALGDLELVATLLDQMGLLHWHRSEIDVAIGYYEQSLSTWQAIGNEVGEAEVRNHRSIALWHLGRYAEAADEMHAALALYEQAGDPQGRQMTLNNLGDVELHLGRYESALDYYERAAAVKEMGRQHMPAWLMNVGTVYRKTGRLDEALECYRRALSICRGIGDRRGEATSLNHIGAWYGQAERDGEALIHFQKALSISREIAEKYQEICALRNIAAVYDRTGRYGIALQRYEESLALARAIGDTYQEACALDGMAKVLARTHGFAHALPHWRRSYRLYEALGVPEAAEVRTRLSEPDGAFGSE